MEHTIEDLIEKFKKQDDRFLRAYSIGMQDMFRKIDKERALESVIIYLKLKEIPIGRYSFDIGKYGDIMLNHTIWLNNSDKNFSSVKDKECIAKIFDIYNSEQDLTFVI